MAKRTIYQDVMAGLKSVLKRRKISYKEVADILELSESSVKRLFNAKDGQFSKVETLCEWLGITIADVISIHDNKNEETYTLTPKQEALFMKYPGAFQFYIELIEYELTVSEIKDSYLLNDSSVTFYLNRLEEVGLIEVHPGNVVKNAIEQEVGISPSGQLSKKLLKTSMDSIYDITIKMMEMKGENVLGKKGTVMTGELLFSKTSAAEIYKEYEDLNQKIAKVSARDCRLYPHKELIPHTYFNAYIPQRIFKDRIPNIQPQ